MNFVHHTKLFFESMFKYKRKLKFIYENNVSNRHFGNKPTKTISVLFFGTDKFSLPSLKALLREQKCNGIVRQLAVVTSFKSKVNPVKKYSNAESIDCFDWPVPNVICKKYDLGVVVSFGHLIPESIISSLPLGMINVHASLLPRWRGAAPIIYALKNGDTKTGVSVMRIRPKHFDIGEVLAQKEVLINEHCLMPELHDTLSNEGADLLIDCLHHFDSKVQNAQQQNPEHVSYAPKVMPELAVVNWTIPAIEIYNLYRALYSFQPLITRWNNLQLKLIEIKMDRLDIVSTEAPGTLEYVKSEQFLRVVCGNGRCICVYKLAIVGKKIMSAADFYNGFLSKCKDINYFV